jgi:hypothetical protein
MTSSAATADSCHVHSSSPLAASDQVQAVGYSESEVETDAADLELETDATTVELGTDAVDLDLETETDVYQEISKQERYLAD